MDDAVQTAPMAASAARHGFSLDQAVGLAARARVSQLLRAGDESLYWNLNISRFMRTAVVPRRVPTMPLAPATRPEVGDVVADTTLGRLSLNDFLGHAEGRTQGFLVVHRGRIVFESYPGMRPDDAHLWASCSKPMASLLIELLIDDGLIDDRAPFGRYVSDFRGTAWEEVRIVDILDMTPGLDTEENDDTRADPKSIAIRTFLAELGESFPPIGRVETVRDVLTSARKVKPAGTSFDYGSPVTQALVILAEEVGGKRWADLFDDRVWSFVGADGDLQIHLSPDGLATTHGIVSSRLRDMARFGMLYTPSWRTTATRQVVTPAIVERIRGGLRSHDFFMRGYDGPVFSDLLGERVECNSRQWDAVFADGDLFKAGFMGQSLYVSPARDLVIVAYSTAPQGGPMPHRFLRPIAASGLFEG